MIYFGVINEIFNFYICQCIKGHYLLFFLLYDYKRELVALLYFSYWCLVIVVWLFLTMQWVCLQFVSVVFPDHTHLLFFIIKQMSVCK